MNDQQVETWATWLDKSVANDVYLMHKAIAGAGLLQMSATTYRLSASQILGN